MTGAGPEKRMAHREPWLAALLSVLVPGFGQGYSGHWAKAAVFFLFATGFTVLGVAAYQGGYAGMTFLPAIGSLFYVLGIIDAYVFAQQGKEEMRKVWGWPLLWLAVAFVLFLASFSAVVMGLILRAYVTERVEISSDDMAPILLRGDRLLVNKQIRSISDLRRGDLVAFHPPQDASAVRVLRVVALPGETVRMGGGRLEVDGMVLPEPYAHHQKDPFTYPPAHRAVWNAEYKVPLHALFLLADSRDGGPDSREWGALPEERLVGRVDFIAGPRERRRQIADSYLSQLAKGFLRRFL